mmetsp:Transcript_40645/g.69118  ORF Transcript_40645/g.69118 Transcript_40645/m.69118 type:complete len:213 (+) Transcript_40645:703-1341(+)
MAGQKGPAEAVAAVAVGEQVFTVRSLLLFCPPCLFSCLAVEYAGVVAAHCRTFAAAVADPAPRPRRRPVLAPDLATAHSESHLLREVARQGVFLPRRFLRAHQFSVVELEVVPPRPLPPAAAAAPSPLEGGRGSDAAHELRSRFKLAQAKVQHPWVEGKSVGAGDGAESGAALVDVHATCCPPHLRGQLVACLVPPQSQLLLLAEHPKERVP